MNTTRSIERFFARILWALATLAAAVALFPCVALGGQAAAQSDFKQSRLWGPTRYDTMAAIVSEQFASCDWAVVATGDNYPDALAASALAGARRCPVILTKTDTLSEQARLKLADLGVKNAYIMGGTGAVSAAVEASVNSMGISTTRVSGGDRMETSVKAMREARQAGSTADTVIVATGFGFADTLSISPWSWWAGAPIVLAKGDGTLTDSQVSAIKGDKRITRVVIVGGPSVVSPSVSNQLGSSYEYQYLSGEDRYKTSKAVAEWAVKNGFSWSYPAVATGRNFPDALAGAPLCGTQRSAMLLASSSSDPTIKLLKEKASKVAMVFLLGGTSVLPDSVLSGEDTGIWVLSRAVIDKKEVYDYELDEHGNVLSEHLVDDDKDINLYLNSTSYFLGIDEKGLWNKLDSSSYRIYEATRDTFAHSHGYNWNLDAAGNVTSVVYETDEPTITNSYKYDSSGQIASIRSYENQYQTVSEITLDGKGLITRETRSGINFYSEKQEPYEYYYDFEYEYDDRGRPISLVIKPERKDASRESERFEYDKNGNVSCIYVYSTRMNKPYNPVIELSYTYVSDPSPWARQMQRLCWQSLHPDQWSRRYC